MTVERRRELPGPGGPGPSPASRDAVFCSNWAPGYGTPYVEDLLDDDGAEVEVAPVVEEAGQGLTARPVPPAPPVTLVFVDGVRRIEAHLSRERDGLVVAGVTGAHAVGAVVCEPGAVPRFEACSVRRVLVWDEAHGLPLEPADGFSWELLDPAPTAGRRADPEQRLQSDMRLHERHLAFRLGGDDRLVVADGPLERVDVGGRRVVGYVKTQHRVPLDAAGRAVVASLRPGERTSLVQRRPDVMSCYLRLPSPVDVGAWGATVRLDVPAELGVDGAVQVADRAAWVLPRYAGVAHADGRAPQNLQPVGALERHLRHLLGDAHLAHRAVHASVRRRRQGVPV